MRLRWARQGPSAVEHASPSTRCTGACELEKRNLEKARSSEGPKRGAKSERRVSFAAIERSPGERVRGFAYGRARILDRWLTEIRRGLASIMCTCCIFHGTPPSSALAQ